MKTRMIIPVVVMVLLTMTTSAQNKPGRFGLEIRPGASIPTSSPGGTELKTGPGFEGLLEYRFLQNTSLYAGWGWSKFASESSFLGEDMDFEETGYVFGLRHTIPLPESPVGIFVRGGGIYNHIEVENPDGEIISDSGHGFGWQAEAGIDLNLGKGWKLRPGVKYQSLSRDLETTGASRNVSLNYISAGVGISKVF
jgi:opacity protein-like surface antigen